MTRHVIVLSDAAAAFMNTPAPIPVVEDIYAISDRREWVVVCTDPQSETKAVTGLRDAQVNAFLPMAREYRKRIITRETRYLATQRPKRRLKTVRKPIYRPLLPGYVFAELPLIRDQIAASAAARVVAVDGAHRILGSTNGPVPIPRGFVDLLREREGAGAFDRTAISNDWITKGAKARISDGPFSGFLSVVERSLPNDLVEVAVDIFGRATRVTLELAQVEKRC